MACCKERFSRDKDNGITYKMKHLVRILTIFCVMKLLAPALVKLRLSPYNLMFYHISQHIYNTKTEPREQWEL